MSFTFPNKRKAKNAINCDSKRIEAIMKLYSTEKDNKQESGAVKLDFLQCKRVCQTQRPSTTGITRLSSSRKIEEESRMFAEKLIANTLAFKKPLKSNDLTNVSPISYRNELLRNASDDIIPAFKVSFPKRCSTARPGHIRRQRSDEDALIRGNTGDLSSFQNQAIFTINKSLHTICNNSTKAKKGASKKPPHILNNKAHIQLTPYDIIVTNQKLQNPIIHSTEECKILSRFNTAI